MKQITLIVCLLISTFSFSQVLRMRVFEVKVNYEPFTKSSSTEWIKTSSVFVMDADNHTVKIYHKNYSQDLAIGQQIEETILPDGKSTMFKAVDDKGILCNFSVKQFNDTSGEHKATVTIEYKNVMYFYRLTNY